MPGIQGVQLAGRFKELHRDARVILMSGYSQPADALAGLGEGIPYLTKPFKVESLVRTVRETLDASS